MITQSSILTAPLITCLNHLADKSNQVQQRLQSHVNETVCFRIGSLIRLHVTITQDGHFRMATEDEHAEVILNIPVELAPRLASGDRDAFREITVCGDPVLADILLYMGKIFQAEIEENLSSALGDVFARRVTLTGQELVRWQLGSIRNLSRALGEFITEERLITVSHTRFCQISSEVALLQQQVSQLEERIDTLISPLSQAVENSSRTGQ
ncbi:ubiquinone biosynthesis protein UbiJ [Nitrosomonas eutropha]|uniref:Ubiquinone biosynthesis protein UbiJ n=1 Tax=Nitrosomonas eutropha TaxID=916 RepID=A0A1I7F5Q9_9PROT|nr:hypothetical protein [Nitrosomonas eutropha]SFU31513.1 ubiquinone biosynthesis protein UbiJ [Nitrosomonas eutropha]